MRLLQVTSAPVRCLAYSPDGRLLAAGSDDHSVQLLSPADGRELSRLTGHADWVRGVAFSPDGKELATAGWDDTVRLWSVAGRKQTAQLDGHAGGAWAVAYAAVGRLLATGAGDGLVRLYQAPDESPRTLPGHRWPVDGLVFNRTGVWLASASHDRTVRLWGTWRDGAKEELTGHSDWVRCVAFSPDDWLASGGDDQRILLWSGGHSARRELVGHTGAVNRLAFTPDGAAL